MKENLGRGSFQIMTCFPPNKRDQLAGNNDAG